MPLKINFHPLELENLMECVQDHKKAGYRCVQMLCINTDEGIDMQYTFMIDDTLENYTIKGVTKDISVPSITEHYLSAFVFENEAHDLFGVNIVGNLLDFGGNFYAISEKEPMTFISPEQKAAKEKAAKIAAAKAAREAQAAKVKAEEAEESDASASKIDSAAIEEKTKGLDPEKAAKVKAAMEAKAARAEKAAHASAIDESSNGKEGE